MKRGLLFASLALALSACGFQPLYSTTGPSSVTEEMAEVRIGRITGPAAPSNFLVEELRETLPGEQAGAGARYVVDLKLRDRQLAVAVTSAANTVRYNYTVFAQMMITDTETNTSRRQNLSTVTSYGVVPSQYASYIGREDAVRRASEDLARKIAFDIALYLKGRAPAPSEIVTPLPPDMDILDQGYDPGTITETGEPARAPTME